MLEFTPLRRRAAIDADYASAKWSRVHAERYLRAMPMRVCARYGMFTIISCRLLFTMPRHYLRQPKIIFLMLFVDYASA